MNANAQAAANIATNALVNRLKKFVVKNAGNILDYQSIETPMSLPDTVVAIKDGQDLLLGASGFESIARPMTAEVAGRYLQGQKLLKTEGEKPFSLRLLPKLGFPEGATFFVIDLDVLNVEFTAAQALPSFNVMVGYRNGRKSETGTPSEQNGNYISFPLNDNFERFFAHICGRPFDQIAPDELRVSILLEEDGTILMRHAPRDEFGRGGGFANCERSIHTTNFAAVGIREQTALIGDMQSSQHLSTFYLGVDEENVPYAVCIFPSDLVLERHVTEKTTGRPVRCTEKGKRRVSGKKMPSGIHRNDTSLPIAEVPATEASVPEPAREVRASVPPADILRPIAAPLTHVIGTFQYIVPTAEKQDKDGQVIVIIDLANPGVPRPATELEIVILRHKLEGS